MLKYLLLTSIVINFIFSQKNDTISVLSLTHPTKLISFQFDFFIKIIEIYNLNNKNKLYFKLVYFDDTEKIYSHLQSYYKKNNFVIGINGSTIYDGTPEYKKFYRYSLPYLPVKSVIIGKKNILFKKNKLFQITLVNIEPYRIQRKMIGKAGYVTTPLYVNSYEDIAINIKQNLCNAYIGDSIDAWLDDDLKVVYEIDGNPFFFGFVYQTGSELRSLLDPTIKYLRKSPIYYSLLRKYFGSDFKAYYKKTMNLD